VLSCAAGQQSRDYVVEGATIHRRGLVQFPGARRLQNLVFRMSGGPLTWQRLHLGLSAFIEAGRLHTAFDIVEYPDWNAEGWVFALNRSLPIVAHLHTPLQLITAYAHSPFTRDIRWSSALESFAVERAHVATTASQILADSLKEVGWLKRSDVDVIPYPLDLSRWQMNAPVSETDPTVVFVGRIERRKAPELLVEALAIVRKRIPRAKGLFLGRSSGTRDGLPYLDWLLKTFGDNTGNRFVGEVPRDQLKAYLAQSRVLAMPSEFDSYGLAAAEAMAAGRPVVASSTTGVAELVQSSGAGSVFQAGNAEALANALLPFLENPSYAQRTGEKARGAALKYHEPDALARHREAAYARALVARGRPANRSAASAPRLRASL
jgi:glycogen(starch) synthase